MSRCLIRLGIAVASLAGAVACESDTTDSGSQEVLWSSEARGTVHCASGFADSVTETPISSAPRITNAEDVLDAISVLPATASVTVRPWILVDSTGNVVRLVVDETGSSGDLSQDTLVKQLMPVIRFRPASLAGRSTCVWIRLPFRLGEAGRP